MKIEKKSNHWDYDVETLGYKYNMNDLTACIGREQLKKIKWLNSSRIKLIKVYLKYIKNLKHIKTSFEYRLARSSYWMMTIRCKKREKLINFLKSNQISTSVHLKPLPKLKVYKKFNSKIPNANKIWLQLITLPLFPDLKKDKVKFISKKLIQFDENYEKF